MKKIYLAAHDRDTTFAGLNATTLPKTYGCEQCFKMLWGVAINNLNDVSNKITCWVSNEHSLPGRAMEKSLLGEQ
jgi:hypothetical protein